MARRNPWTVSKDTKSASWIVSFSYRNEHGNLRRYRKSAGRGVGKREADRKARALYREKQRDPLAFVETFAQNRYRHVVQPFHKVAERYHAEEVMLRCRPSTQRTHEQILRVHLVPCFGDLDIRSIRKSDVSRYVADKRGSGLSAKSVNNHTSVLSSLYRFAITHELCEANPTQGVKPLRVDNSG